MELEYRCRYCNILCKKYGLKNHEFSCKLNPNRNLCRIIHHSFTCKICKNEYKTKIELYEHKRIDHNIFNNGGQQIKLELKCKFCGLTKNYTKSIMSIHELHCEMNPNRIPFKGHEVSEETKKKISQSMHIAAQDGRNKGWSITRSGPQRKSYPEEFFTKVIENEFMDKNYEYNMIFYTFKLDFAWVDKKKCIEIDGSQHERILQQKESDIRKDRKLLENGWQVLRIKWKDLFHYPNLYIKIAKNFIELDNDEE